MGTKEKKRRRRRILSIDLYSGGGGSLSIRMKGGERVDNEDAAGYCGGIRIRKKKTIKKMDVLF